MNRNLCPVDATLIPGPRNFQKILPKFFEEFYPAPDTRPTARISAWHRLLAVAATQYNHGLRAHPG